jgi:hypothetical protein
MIKLSGKYGTVNVDIEEDITFDELLDKFVKFAASITFQESTIEGGVIRLAERYLSDSPISYTNNMSYCAPCDAITVFDGCICTDCGTGKIDE